MESEMYLLAEGDDPVDLDVCDPDSFDAPDPGLLMEKNELSFTEPLPDSEVFTSSQQWQSMTPHARARQLWLLLRAGLHDIVEKEKRDELRVARLTHGLEPLRRLEVAAGLCSVAQDPVCRRFVVLDRAGRLHVHREDGWAQEKRLAPVRLTGLVAVLGPLGATGRFVGWGPAGLAILGPDLSLLWLSEPGVGRGSDREPTCCLPVPNPGLLLVAEVGGGVALWKFRSRGRRLVPLGSTLQPPPSPPGAIMRLALAPAPPHQVPRCFAAYGSAVLTFDLQAWALVDVRRDLHKTTISDLAFCQEAEAMVTASRDSTVKVWEADWQIRMVFVGHTGPVTAMAVLPNTPLVLSASQDGTLRTWDLRGAAQVGEVSLCYWGQDVLSGHVSSLLAPVGPNWPVLALCRSSVLLWRVHQLYTPLAQLSAPVLHLQVAPTLPVPAHPSLPSRIVCACADGSVYLVSTATGRTVSALLLEPDDCAAAVAYCLPREALWVLTRAGHLVRANAARCPMDVQYRVRPPPSPAPQPCCLHLYSHLIDPESAFATWEIVRQHRGELRRSTVPWAWKNKNRYLPVLGHTDGSLSVLDWHSSKVVFHTEAHSPGPVTALASTWNSVVSSGGDLTVKMWRAFPYSEESLSLLRTFSCCHLAVRLCALDRRITVGFEDPNTATYGLVQFGLGDSRRCDHRPQDDPLDHITGLCCCPVLKLYASSSLDGTIRIWTAENRLLRLLQLNGAPQALAFCSDSGDLVLALGSHLCLVPHRLYLPTSYLVKNLCQKAPDTVDDPPLPLASQETLTSAQLQRLTHLHRTTSLSVALSLIRRQTALSQQPVVKEDWDALVARNQDLQQLGSGLVVPAARPPASWQQRQEAFDNYLRVIYGPGMLGMQSGWESQQCSTVALAGDREAHDPASLLTSGPCPGQTRLSVEAQAVPKALPLQDLGALGQHVAPAARLVSPTYRRAHSTVSQLLACSSLSSCLGLSLDLQLQAARPRLQGQAAAPQDVRDTPPSQQQHRVPLLLKRRPQEPLSRLGGFFPATTQLYQHHLLPVSFPGYVPNSAVLQRLWLPEEVGRLGSLAPLTSSNQRLKPVEDRDDLWHQRTRRHHSRWRTRLTQWLGAQPWGDEEEEEEELDLDLDLDWVSAPLEPQLEPEALSSANLTLQLPDSARTETDLHLESYSGLLWEERYGRLPRFLQVFVGQNWFKKLFPLFTLKAYPEMGTVEGLASLLLGLLEEATWADRVHILHALLRLLPEVSSDLRGQLQGILLHLLNLDQPPSLQDQTQERFVILALQLLLACSLESLVVVLELMAYFLCSPATCRPAVRKLLDGLGLQDPEGFLVEEMMAWVQGQDQVSKAVLRRQCRQKLDDMIQQFQVDTLQLPVAKLSVPPRVSPSKDVLAQASPGVLAQLSTTPLGLSWMPSGISASPSSVSEVSSHILETPSLVPTREPELDSATGALQVQPLQGCPWGMRRALSQPLQGRSWGTRRALSQTLQRFCLAPESRFRSSAPSLLPGELLPLVETQWAQSQMVDLGAVEALNYFCEQRRAQHDLLQEKVELAREPGRPPSPRAPVPNTVTRQPPDGRHYPILRLQEAAVRRSALRLRGRLLPRLSGGRAADGSIRVLKLPLPRVELRPFPPGWPAPVRPRAPLLLQPALQRYFVPGDTDPDSYR